MKVIETVYNGYRFRSRLEARYAVFFNRLSVPYEYEWEGFDLDGKRYLPDFWLPVQQRWIEIKGQKPTAEELAKVKSLEEATGYPSCLFYGLPGDNDGWAYFTCAHGGNAGKSFSDKVQWRRCPVCSTVDVNIRHHDECHLYSEIDGIELRSSSCQCTRESYKEYHRSRILKGGSKQLCGQELDEEDFKKRTEAFVTELADEFYPDGLAVAGVDRRFHGTFSGFADAYTAARRARFEYGESG
jgi:hypothetical protein